MRASERLTTLYFKLLEKFKIKNSNEFDNPEPDWLNFTTYKFGNWIWTWKYEIHPSSKKYEITDLNPLCPFCMNRLISLSDSFSSSTCPLCHKQFHNITFWVSTEDVHNSINEMIKKGLYNKNSTSN